MIKRSIDACAEFDIFTPSIQEDAKIQNGGKTERTWYLMWKTADRGTVMEGKPQAPVVRKADNAIHRIKRCPPNKALSSG